ncbi:hypothetical protein AOQ84DRAFT_11085 [Glonium stellatum]|uniref:Uncharacterized protein n=1 Tax=Glonium stellatum TaxID=574774 RepID=A0A8E2EMG9_9PEZI|nr:hypothetical protein AOQ84DRAFT_11085 [Glonium stellatum]
MANPRKTYFLTPSFDYPPTGPILLGNIISSPKYPDKPLNRASPGPAIPAAALTTTTKTDWKSTAAKSHAGRVGLWAKFLEVVVGVGVDVGTSWERGTADEYRFDRLETLFFEPLAVEGYLESVMKAPGVLRYLEKSRGRKPLYIVKGVKIARGASAKTLRTRADGGRLGVSVDGTLMAAPVNVGPELEAEVKKEDVVEFGGSDDFVFAYRLGRIKIDRKTGGMEEEDHDDGALFGLPGAGDDEDEEEKAVFFVTEVEGDEAVAGEFGEEEITDTLDDDEDDENCACILLK